jgi:hypothetical protein
LNQKRLSREKNAQQTLARELRQGIDASQLNRFSIGSRALSAMPSDQLDTVAKINKAITEALAAHQMRKDRIEAVSDRTAARNLG